MNEWISVEDRLPDKPDEYIVANVNSFEYSVTTMEWTGLRWFSNYFPNEDIKLVTHWMPLPDMPTI